MNSIRRYAFRPTLLIPCFFLPLLLQLSPAIHAWQTPIVSRTSGRSLHRSIFKQHSIKTTSTAIHAKQSPTSPDTSPSSFLSSSYSLTGRSAPADDLLAYLPDHSQLPPQFRQLVLRATQQHMYGVGVVDTPRITLDELFSVLETEFRVRNPSSSTPRSVTVRWDDDETKEQQTSETLELVYIMSLAALHKLPKEITLELLRTLRRHDTNSNTITNNNWIQSFATVGWSGVTFPRGLAVRRRGRWRFLAPDAARRLCHGAAATQAPRPVNRTQFLQSLITTTNNNSSTTATTAMVVTTTSPNTSKLYFPPPRRWRRLRRWLRRPMLRLRQHGTAGVVSYCALNWLWYTTGFVVLSLRGQQKLSLWRRMVCVYAAAQVVKLPKLVVAAALAPYWQRVLRKTSTRETVAAAVWVASMVAVFGMVVGGVVWWGQRMGSGTPIPLWRPAGLVMGV